MDINLITQRLKLFQFKQTARTLTSGLALSARVRSGLAGCEQDWPQSQEGQESVDFTHYFTKKLSEKLYYLIFQPDWVSCSKFTACFTVHFNFYKSEHCPSPTYQDRVCFLL